MGQGTETADLVNGVARELASVDRGCPPPEIDAMWNALDESQRAFYRVQARAVLDALRADPALAARALGGEVEPQYGVRVDEDVTLKYSETVAAGTVTIRSASLVQPTAEGFAANGWAHTCVERDVIRLPWRETAR